jgi:hypothetical protein
MDKEVKEDGDSKVMIPNQKIGVIVAGSIASSEITEAIVKALVLEGIDVSSIIVTTVSDVYVLPYATVNLFKKVGLVISSGIVTNDLNGSSYLV